MDDCIFCKIATKQIPKDFLYEDAETLAFLDIKPNNPGHTLVIPKHHYRNLYDIPEAELQAMLRAAKRLAPAITRAVGASGINLIMNNEAAAGQIIFHAHLHLVPRLEEDGFKHWPGRSYQSEEEAKVVETIRNELSAS